MSNSSILQFSPFITRKRLKYLISFIAIFNFLLLAGTFCLIFESGPIATYLSSWNHLIQTVLPQFNLAEENILSSWYSSILMLAVAAVSILCFLADACLEEKPEYRRLSFGWLLVAAIFLLLSADEMGSFHERIGMLASIPTDKSLGWVPIFEVPIGVVAGLFVVFSWLKMSRYRFAALLTVVGTGLYIMNPTLEELQNLLLQFGVLSASQEQLYNFSVLVEEGGEIFGSLAFLTSTLLYCGIRLNTINASSINPCHGIRIQISTASILNILYTFAGVFAFIMLSIERADIRSWIGDTGVPENWFPSAMAFLSSLVCLLMIDSLRRSRSFHSYLYLLYAVFCLTLSLYYGLNTREFLPTSGMATTFSLEWTHHAFVMIGFILNPYLGFLTKRWGIGILTACWPLMLYFSLQVNSQSSVDLMDLCAMTSMLCLLLLQLYGSRSLKRESSPMAIVSLEQ